MNDTDFLSLIWTQLIQVSVLIAVVWLLAKRFARQRPHLAHVLWLLVLVKCLTPPVMSSPAGVMSHLKIPQPDWLTIEQAEEVEEVIPEPGPIDLAPDIPREPLPDFQVSDANFEIDDLSRGFVIDESELPPEFFFEEPLEVEVAETPVALEVEEPPIEVKAEPPVSSILWKIWFASAGFVLLVTFARVSITIRRVYRNRVETPEDLDVLVLHLSRQLKLRRKVRILVTAAKVGPAVVGFFRPLLILPQVVTNGRSAHELEPIIAHELLHVKRGDLGVGWLQVLVQSLWWFHPLVWLVNRFLSREAERCCDEAVVAELDCPPAAYARCLLNVLEQKRNLTPIPACPGVKPVELTKQRMERIMKLGQGCRKRSPWWCWLVVVLLGVVVLPGRGESDAEGNQSTVIFQLKEAHAAKVTTEIEKEGTGATTESSQELITRTYSIDDVVQRMCNDHDLTEQAAQIHLELLVSSSISSLEVGPQFQGSASLLTKCIISENTLIVRGTREGHELVKGLLKLWKDAGLYQITVTTRFASTDVQVSAENVAGKQDANSALTAKLTELDAYRLVNTMQSDARTNILFAPKVTLFNGQQAVVQDEVVRPFVTGMNGDEAVIESLPEGWRLSVKPTVDAEGEIELEYQLRLAGIVDVDTKELQGRQGKELGSVQIPDARQSHVRSSVKLKDGETLLISGLSRRSASEGDAENLMVLITPTLEKVELHPLSQRGNGMLVSQAHQRIHHNDGTMSVVSTETRKPPTMNLVSEDPDEPSTLTYQGGRFSADNATKLTIPKMSVSDGEFKAYYRAYRKAAARLDQPATASYFQTPLTHALLDIHQKTGLRIVLDHARLEQAGISPDTKIDVKMSGVRWQTVLYYVAGEGDRNLGFCVVPVYDAVEEEYVPTIFVSPQENIIDVSLALRARSIPVICAPDDLQSESPNPVRKQILDKLARPLDRDFHQMPFVEFLKHIAKNEGVSVVIMSDEATEPQKLNAAKIDYRAGSLRLGLLLEQTCKPLGLTFYVGDEVAMITTTEKYENEIVTKVYSARDLWPENLPQNQPNPRQVVVDHVRKTFAPESWQDSNEFKIVPHEEDYALFLIRQRRKVHEQIREQAAKKMSGTGVNSDSGVTGTIMFDERYYHTQRQPTQAQPARPWIKHTWSWLKHTPPWQKYDREISVSFERTPLKQAIKEICAAGDLKVLFLEDDKDGLAQIIELGGYPQVICDENDLEEAAKALSAPVTFSAQNEAAIPILEDILKPFGLGLGYLGPHGQSEGRFDIRSQDFLDRTGWNVVYPVGDLLENDKTLRTGPTQGSPILNKLPHQEKLLKAKPKTKSEIAGILIEILEKALTWDHSEANMATGTMKYRESAEALVIQCNRSQHDLIEKLLCERRKACGIDLEPAASDDGPQYESPPGSQNSTRVFPNPLAAEQIDDVQLRFLGPERSHLTIHVPDRLQTSYQLLLPGRKDLAAGKTYSLTLENVPGKMIKSTWPVPYTHDPKFHWMLEIPEGNEQSKVYLDHNAIPLSFTEEDLDQVAANNIVTKVIYLPKPDQQELAVSGIETLVSTRLDPGVDPVEEATRRGTILAVLRSHTGKFMSGTGMDSDSVVVGQIVSEEDSEQVDPELWKILVRWEQAGNDYKKVSSEFRRFVYDAESQIEKRSKGTLSYAMSGAWHLDVEPEKIDAVTKSQKLSPQGKPYSLKSDEFGFSICDGTRVAVAQHDIVKMSTIPEEYQGRDLFRQPEAAPFAPPVPFVIGLPAEVAVPRYQFTLLPNTDEQSIWLRILPKRLSDRKNWTSAEVILDRKTFLPFAIKLTDAAGSTETVYKFTDFKVNSDAGGKALDLTKLMKEYKPLQRSESILSEETKSTPDDNHPQPLKEDSTRLSSLMWKNSRFFSDLRARRLEQQIVKDNEEILRTSASLRDNPAKLENPLQSHVSSDFQEAPIEDVLKWVQNRVRHVEFEITPKAQQRLRESNATYGWKDINLQVGSVLNLALQPHDLGYVFDPEERSKAGKRVIRITAIENDETQFTRRYPVGDIRRWQRHIADSNGLPSFIQDVPHLESLFSPKLKYLADSGEILADLIRSTVEEKQWWVKEGRIHYLPHTETIIVTAPKSVHAQVGEKLQQVREELAKQSNALANAEPSVPVESQNPPQEPLIAIVYPVADLVVPIPGFDNPPANKPPADGWGKPITGSPISVPGPPHLPLGGPAKPARETSPQAGDLALRAQRPDKSPFTRSTPQRNSDASPLIELITQTLKSTNDQKLPEGTNLSFVQEQLCLVVRATGSDHDLIADLLSDIRRKQGLQVVIDCKVLQLTDEALDGARFGSITLNTEEAAQHVLNVVQGQKGAQIIAAPKLTTFNGVGAQIQISRAVEDKRDVENMHYMIVPTVSSDRRSVDVNFAVNPTSSLDVLSKAKSMTIPDGYSVLVEVTDELIASTKRSGIPEVDKALRDLKKKELGVRTFVLLTPKIIVQEEEEESPGLPPGTEPKENLLNKVDDQVESDFLITVKPVIIIQEEEEELLNLEPTKKGKVLMDTPRGIIQEEEEALLGIPE